MIQIGRTGGEPVGLQAKFLNNGDVKITKGPPVPALSLEPVMVSALQPPTRYHDGQVPAGVRACVPHATAEHYHGRIEQGSILGIFGFLEKIEKPCELPGIKGFDDGQLLEQVRTFSVVGQRVVPVGDSVKGKQTVPPRMSEGDDVGQVCLQGKGHEFVHHGGIVGIGQINEVLVIPLDDSRAGLWFGHVDPFRPPLDLAFDVSDRGQIFLELLLIGTG